MDKENNHKILMLGTGQPGGKGSGLIFIQKIIDEKINKSLYPNINIDIPKFTIIKTGIFDEFIKRNGLLVKALSDDADDTSIAIHFQKASLPAEIVGELRTLIQKFHTPLAVRSSSMLEDSLEEPFAGIYETKMVANNSPFIDDRGKILNEAIKLVYSSVFFKKAKDYFKATKHKIEDEKMAVVIQEVAGSRHYDRFYPEISGVARSFNYYPMGRSKPEQGIVQLALGLGKTIVDGGIAWNYSPAFPKISSPFSGISDLMKKTQVKFWAINMGPIFAYDPTKETEYMSELNLKEAEYDGTLNFIASTYDSSSDRISMGIGNEGPRILNFSQLLHIDEFGFNKFISEILKICEQEAGNPVEIEFAISIDKINGKLNFHFLQLRPMYVSKDIIDISDEELNYPNNLLSSDKVLGNGIVNDIYDIVYVKKDVFNISSTDKIAEEIEIINRNLMADSIRAVFMGFGRWGSSDRWLGIPVNWGQISSAKAIVEITLPNLNVDLSQGSHFFHNLTSFKVSYFSVQHDSDFKIDWNWMETQKVIEDMKFVRHIRTEKPLIIRVDGRKSRGVIQK
jgi:hypothetical protein